jgi:hypothetical protein
VYLFGHQQEGQGVEEVLLLVVREGAQEAADQAVLTAQPLGPCTNIIQLKEKYSKNAEGAVSVQGPYQKRPTPGSVLGPRDRHLQGLQASPSPLWLFERK